MRLKVKFGNAEIEVEGTPEEIATVMRVIIEQQEAKVFRPLY